MSRKILLRANSLFLIPLILIFSLIVLHNGCSKSSSKYRIGILCGLDFFAATVDGFKEKMKELGYVEGENIVYDFQRSRSDTAAACKILQKFVDEKVDLIFVLPTDVSVTAKRLTKGTKIPVIFANANVEGVNLINNIREPGDNITGVRFPGPDLTLKRFEILTELVPDCNVIWVPYKRNMAIVPAQLNAIYPSVNARGIKLIETPVSDVEELKLIISGFEKNKTRIDAILMIAEPLVVTPNTFYEMGKFAHKKKIPIGGAMMNIKGMGSIFGVATDDVSVGKQAATLANKVFKGISPGTIPVISAENFVQINYTVAKQFDLNVSDGLLKQADKIIR